MGVHGSRARMRCCGRGLGWYCNRLDCLVWLVQRESNMISVVVLVGNE